MSGSTHTMTFQWQQMVLEANGGHDVSNSMSVTAAPGDTVRFVLQEFPLPQLQFLFSNDGGGLINHVKSDQVSQQDAKRFLTQTPPTIDNANHTMDLHIASDAAECQIQFDVQLQVSGRDFNFDPLIDIKRIQ